MATLALTYNDTELSLLQKKPFGYSWARVELPAGLVSLGRIVAPQPFGALLKQAMASAQPSAINADRVIIGLPEEQAFIKIVELPAKLREHEVVSAIELQWQNLLPIARQQVYYSSVPLKNEEKQNEKTAQQQHLIVAYQRDLVDNCIQAIQAAGLVVQQVVPLSFGLARLFSLDKEAPTLVLRSTSGAEASVAIVHKETTRFSTVIHAPVIEPAFTKQVNNIRTFYERSVPNSKKINAAAILPGAYSSILAQQATTLKLTVTSIAANNIIHIKGLEQADTSFLLPLFGLLKVKNPLSVLPDSLRQAARAYIQLSLLRSYTIATLSAMAIILYFSLVFFGSVTFVRKDQPTYSATFIQRLNNESQKVNEQASDFNQLVQRAYHLRTEYLPLSLMYEAVSSAGKEATGITVTNFSFSREQLPATLRLNATGTTAQLTQFVAALQKTAIFQGTKIETNSTSDMQHTIVITQQGSPQ